MATPAFRNLTVMKSKGTVFIWTLALICFLALLSFCRADHSLRVGVAKVDITPDEPLPMWGYASRHDALSEGVLDPLFAEALVIQPGDQKIALVTLDLGRVPSEASLSNIVARIKHETGIRYTLITASHTHHGPVMELSDEEGKGKGRFDASLRYYHRLETEIVDAVIQANQTLQPAKLAVGTTHLDGFNLNRASGFIPAPCDRDLVVMRFDGLTNQPIAIVANFAAHPTLVPETVRKFSADYVGALRTSVEKETGANFLFLQGAAGDLAANYRTDFLGFGRDLAAQIIKFSSTLKAESIERPSLQVADRRFKFACRLDLGNPAVRRRCDALFFPELISNYVDQYAAGVQPHLTVAVLNQEIAFVGGSGEFFSSHSIRLKERARFKNLFFVGYCNGYDGYFPTIEAFAEGGYEVEDVAAPAAVGAGEEMMNAALIELYQMRGQIPKEPSR
jgi:hypothetical protein